MTDAADSIRLRDVTDADVDTFFEHMQDPTARHMAAFTGKDPADHEAHVAHWSRIRSNPVVITKTVLLGGEVVGHVASFEIEGDREVTYWIDRAGWGKGIATAALRELLKIDPTRPIHARAAADNIASIRVLEKCGFEAVGRDRGFANARGEEIDEVVMRLA